MKKIVKALFPLVGAVAVLSACTDDPDYTWAEKETGQKFWFSNTAQAAYELDENQSSVSFWVYRNNPDKALTVDIDAACVTEGAGELFTVPTQAVFAAGEDKARIRILFKFSEIEGEKKYEFKAAIKDAANVSKYGTDKLEFSLVFNPDWDYAGQATMTYELQGLSAEVQIQRKPGTNLFRIKKFTAQLLRNTPVATLIADEWISNESEVNDFIADVEANGDNLVFSLDDDWQFVPAKDQDKSATLWGGLLYDGTTVSGAPLFSYFFTENWNAANAGYTSFGVSGRTYYIQTVAATVFGSINWYSNFSWKWHTNAFVPAEEWLIETDYNADFTYEDVKDATFSSVGFPAISDSAVKIQQATDVEGLFYIPDAFGVTGKGLAFYADANGAVTIPADQPTGIFQQGMEVLAGQGSDKSHIKADGTYELNVEYYMIEETQKEADLPTEDEEDEEEDEEKVDPVPDPDDPAYEWPSGKVGEGERYEIVPEEPVEPAPVPEPEPIIVTRRISLGSFVEKFVTSPATIDAFCGTYELNAQNFGVDYLGDYLTYYPDVEETVGPLEVTVAKGEKENEVVITGLFSGAANGDFKFDGAKYAGKDKVTGVWNSIGNYILISPQTLKDKISFPSTAAGKPNRAFELKFSPMDTESGEASEQPLAIRLTEDGLVIVAASEESEGVIAYAFYSSYDDFSEPINYDIPAEIVLTKK